MDVEELYLFDSTYLLRRRMAARKKRSCWMSPIYQKRKTMGEYNHLHNDLEREPAKFSDYYRMRRDTFNYILNSIEHSVSKESNFRETISPSERLSVTLRYFATGSSFKTLGYTYRMSDVTVGRIVKETSKAILDKLQATHMAFPSTDQEIESIKQRFWERWRFPNCVGCVDGKHVRIRNPQHSGSMFRNYKQFFSIVLQGVAGPDYRFIAVDVGGYGKESDGGIFSHSYLSENLEKGALGSQSFAPLPGTNIKVPHVILGDGAYPLKTYLMRPFPGVNLDPAERLFNRRLSKARQVIECTFGIISNKWRLLLKGIEVEPDFVDTIVQCICLLHNIVLDKEGEQQVLPHGQEDSNDDNTTSRPVRFTSLGENRGSNAAYKVRDKFVAFFSELETV